jgi:uncharacterized protein YpbB
MIKASEARELNNVAKDEKIQEYVKIMIDKIDTQIRKAKDKNFVKVEFENNMALYKDKIFQNIKIELETEEMGYTVEFVKGELGDSRELLDYGTPDSIKVIW